MVFINPKSDVRTFEPDGDLVASSGNTANEVHVKFSENLSTYLLFNVPWDDIFKADGVTNWGTDRDTTVSNLNSDILNTGLPYPKGLAVEVKNDHGSALSKGDPVVFKSYDGTNDIVQVELARADNSAKMPAQYILQEDIANGSTGNAVSIGLLEGMDTSSFSHGDQLYVAPTGGLTATIPTGSNIVQEVATVLAARLSPDGLILIQGLGNDESRLSDVAISGDYDDLTNTPDIPLDVETYDFAGDRTLNTNGNDFNLKNGAVTALQFDASALQINVPVPLGLSNKTTGGQVKFKERSINGANEITIKAPDALSADTTYTLPSADGSSGQFLKTDGSGNLSFGNATSSTITQVYSQSFIDDIGTTKHYIPWKDINEQTTIYQEEAAMLMPFDGRVVSTSVQCTALSVSSTLTIGIHTKPTGLSPFGPTSFTQQETESMGFSATDDFHTFHFVFDNATHFSAGDMCSISIQSLTDPGSFGYWYVTSVVEFDTSNGLGSTSTEHETNP